MKHHYVYITKIVLKILLKIYSKILRANTSKCLMTTQLIGNLEKGKDIIG